MLIKNKKIKIMHFIIIILISFLAVFFLPYIFNCFKANDITKIGFIIFGIDVLTSLFEGFYIGYLNYNIILLTIFPILFFICSPFFFIDKFKYLAVFFGIISFLAYEIIKD